MGMQDSLVEQIQPAVLTRLTAHAQRAGKTVNDLLKDMLDERERITQQQGGPTARAQMTPDEWSHALRTWAASHPVSPVLADDSRESIYAERGE
jgi:hypothetical protein